MSLLVTLTSKPESYQILSRLPFSIIEIVRNSDNDLLVVMTEVSLSNILHQTKQKFQFVKGCVDVD
jgi:quinolinate synthase